MKIHPICRLLKGIRSLVTKKEVLTLYWMKLSYFTKLILRITLQSNKRQGMKYTRKVGIWLDTQRHEIIGNYEKLRLCWIRLSYFAMLITSVC